MVTLHKPILFEGVHKLDAFDNLAMLEIFRVDCIDLPGLEC